MEATRWMHLADADRRWFNCEAGESQCQSEHVEAVSIGASARSLLRRWRAGTVSTGVSSRTSSTVRYSLLAVVSLCVLTFFVVVSKQPDTPRRLTNANLDRYFLRSAALDHNDTDRRDVLLPDEWVREYRLCERDVAARKWEDDHKEGQLFWGGDPNQPSDHNAFLDPGQCTTVEDVPSAHRVGRGGYPEIRLSLTKEDLLTIYGVDGLDTGNPADKLKVLPAEQIESLLSHFLLPLEVVLQVRAARFDPRRGEFVLTVWVERLYYDHRQDGFSSYFSILSFAEHFKLRTINYLFNRARQVARVHAKERGLNNQEQKAAAAAASPFECAFQPADGGELQRSTMRRIYAANGAETMSAFRFACTYPLHPTRPPSATTFQMELRADKEWKPIADIPPQQLRDQPVLGTASLRMCSRVERRVAFAYCGAAVYNDRNLPYLRSFIRHHAYLGVQVFHLYVRYDPSPLRDLLADEIRVGLVQLHPTPESIYWYLNGHPRPYAPYLDQHLHQLECMSNHHESAQYILSTDIDEYMYFPQPQNQKPTDAMSDGDEQTAAASAQPPPPPSPRPTKDNWHIEQYAATCLTRTADGVVYFTGTAAASSPSPSQLPPVYFLYPAAAAASPGSVSPAVYTTLTHMPPGCRSMMADMLVLHARPWAATSRHELHPGQLPSLGSVPHPYPYFKTALPMNAPMALPFSMELRDWLHRAEDGACGRRRVTAAESSDGAAGECTLPTSDWTPSAKVPPPVCPLMMRFPWPVAWPDVATVPPKSLFRARADTAIEIHGVTNPPSRDSDPHPQFKQLLSTGGVHLLHFVSMHRAKQRHFSHLNASETAAEAALVDRDSSQSPFGAFHRRMMDDLERIPEEQPRTNQPPTDA